MTERLKDCLVACDVRPELDQFSDHLHVSTKLLLETEKSIFRRRRLWKKLDTEKLKDSFPAGSPQPERALNSREAIDAYVDDLTNAIGVSIGAAVPWASPLEMAKPFWSKECHEAVKNARRAKRLWSESRSPATWAEYLRTCNKRKEQ